MLDDSKHTAVKGSVLRGYQDQIMAKALVKCAWIARERDPSDGLMHWSLYDEAVSVDRKGTLSAASPVEQ